MRARRSTLPALVALALGGFGIGATEFAAMGLLPEIAQNLLPAQYATDPEAALGRVGALITAYALGVVVGAPTIAAWVAKHPRRAVLLWLGASFTALTVLSSLAPTLETAIVARFLAGLPHGAYFGIASLAAADLMGPGMRGRGVASVLLGLTVANIVGVPAVTAVGQAFDWRAAYFAIAAIFACATAAIAMTLPSGPGQPAATIRSELSALASGRVWLAIGIGAIGFGGFFAAYSYVSPLITEVAGLPVSAVPWTLAAIGIGMTCGTVLGGRLADRSPLRSLALILPLFALMLCAIALIARQPVALVIGLMLLGFLSSTMGPLVQVRLMDVARDAQTLAAALNHSALNIGNGVGAALAAAVVAAGLGFRAPLWAGAILAAFGVLMVLGSLAADRRAARDR